MSCTVTLVLAVAAVWFVQPAVAVRRDEAARKAAKLRGLQAAGLPDPKCSTGIIGAKLAGQPQVCCAGYCGECSDYPTCSSVRGQNSTNACCQTQVYEMRCGSAPANVCLKKCSEALPPCIMEAGEVFTTPDPSARAAGPDCNKAVEEWRLKAAAATSATTPAPSS
uniref:VDE lipocalin domain-containing protein n=1 Tax=Alexandrium monilatum TaxID=311494 RepID=A0A7S4SDG3_9DINO